MFRKLLLGDFLWYIFARHKLKKFNGLSLESGFEIDNTFNFVNDCPCMVDYATLSSGCVL